MNKNVVALLEILSNEHVYSLSNLKIKLGNKKIFLTEEQIIELIVNTLFESICHFKIEKPYDSKNLYKCFKYLNAGNNLNYIKNSEVQIDILNRTIKKINKKIDSKKGNINNICRDNIEFLLKIRDNIELTLIQLSVPKEENIDSKDEIENVLYNFIFVVKKYNYVSEILKTFPELINFKSHCNKYILDDVVTKYIESLNNFGNNINEFDVIYYEKIINLFIENEKFSISKEYQDKLINRLLLTYRNLSNNDFSVRKTRKIRFFLNAIMDKLNKVEITSSEQFFSNINYRYGIHDIYNNSYFEQHNKNCNIEKNKTMLDLTDRYTFTVDNKGTKSFDDAFSLVKNENGNYELDVYISDVSRFIVSNSRIDELAFKKGATIYLPNYILTMLPHQITYDTCSLVKDCYRNAIAHRFVLSKNFDIISFNIEEAIIKIDDNFNYNNINDILNSNDINKMKVFSTMIDIANSLKHNNIYNNDYHIIKSIKKKFENPTEQILEKYENNHTNFVDSFMILTNYFVSDLFSRLNFPFIYRVNTSNVNLKLIDKIKENQERNLSSQILDCINKLYKPSYYSAANLGHNGLNLSSYGHVTIPIRNYASLLSQRLEHKYFINSNQITDKMMYDDEQMIVDVTNYVNDRIFYNEEYCNEYKQKIKSFKNN